MKQAILVAIVVSCAACSLAQNTDNPAPSKTDILAGESLRRSTVDMLVSTNAAQRAGRLVALCRFAHRLDPDNPQTNHLLANVVYRSQGRLERVTEALKAYLVAYPLDHEQSLLYLQLSMDAKNTAEERKTWLRSFAGRSELGKATRAEALARCGDILLGQGMREEAKKTFTEALQLDRLNVSAVKALATLNDTPPAVARAELLLTMLQADAGNVSVASELGGLLQSISLSKESLVFHKHVLAVQKRRSGGAQAPYASVVRLCNALLDAGKAEECIATGEPMLKHFANSVDLRMLLAEAMQATGKKAQAEKQIDAIEAIFSPAETTKTISNDLARRLAMFYLVTRPDAEKALLYARKAADADDEPVIGQRVLGAAEIKSGKPIDIVNGATRLGNLRRKDLYAAVLLAEHYFATGGTKTGKSFLLDAAKMNREGPAFRRLRALANKHKIELPPVEGEAEIAKLARTFDRRYLEMASQSEKYITVTIQPIQKQVRCGQAIEVELVLSNVGPLAAPLGEPGLMRTVARLKVTVSDDKTIAFDDFPLVVWPAPRYLQPGEKITCRARLDIGKLGKYLALRPLSEIMLKVSAKIDPLTSKTTVVSAVPNIKIQPTSITRENLLGVVDSKESAGWAEAYNRALGLIVSDLKHTDPAVRMRAGRQTASLIALARASEEGEIMAPKPLVGKINKKVLCKILKLALKDTSAAVRSEVIAAMHHVSLNRETLTPILGAIQDPSPLVRIRIIELIADSRAVGVKNLIEHFSKDSDELVRLMAGVFAKQEAVPRFVRW